MHIYSKILLNKVIACILFIKNNEIVVFISTYINTKTLFKLVVIHCLSLVKLEQVQVLLNFNLFLLYDLYTFHLFCNYYYFNN